MAKEEDGEAERRDRWMEAMLQSGKRDRGEARFIGGTVRY